MTNQEIILAGIAVYLAGMVGLGLWASRRARSAEDFLVAGRSLPVWVCTATIIATWIGGSSMLGVSGQAYVGGLYAVIADPIGAAIGILLIGVFVIRTVRRMRLLTVIEFVEHRYGASIAMLWAFYGVVASIGWIGATMVAFGFVFNTMAGLPLQVGIVLGGAIVVIYAVAGGMWAVALTDFAQLVIIVVGILVLLLLVVIDMGGITATWQAIPPDKLQFFPGADTPEAWLNYLRALFIIGVANLSAQPLLQRGLSARNEREAQRSFYFASVGYLAIGLVPVALGILGSIVMPGLQDNQAIVPTLAAEYLHPLMMAIFVGALVSAIMSSADSALLATASIVSVNILPRMWRGAAQKKLATARITILIAGLIAMVVALQAQTIFELILMINAPGLAATVAPFIVALWWKKANRTGGWAAIVAGLVTWALTSIFAPGMPGDLLGMAAAFGALFVFSSLSQRIDPPSAPNFVRAD